MKTLLKLVIALVVLNAVGRGGMAALDYYRLRDEAERLVVFDQQATPEELRARIVEMGVRLELPLAPDGVTVERTGARTSASVAYTALVEFFPTYTYPVPLSFTVTGFSTGPIVPGPTP